MPRSQLTKLFVLPVTTKRCWRRFLAGGASMRTRPQQHRHYAIFPHSILNNTLGESHVFVGILVTFVTPNHLTRINFRFLTILPPRRGLERQPAECSERWINMPLFWVGKASGILHQAGRSLI